MTQTLVSRKRYRRDAEFDEHECLRVSLFKLHVFDYEQ